MMRWTEVPIHFVDFEGAVGSGVVEYGVVTLKDNAIKQTHTRLCAPTAAQRPEDVEIHGLADAQLASKPPFSDDWELFAGLRETGPLAAHFAGTENSLLKSVWPYPRNSPDFARPGEAVIDWGPWIDSARIFAQLFPKFKSSKLEALVRACGLQEQLDKSARSHCPEGRRQYHSALYDALAGAHLLLFLANDERVGKLSVMQVLALSVLDPASRDSILQKDLF